MAGALSAQDAERLRAFERRGHDALASSYYEFFTPVTALAIEPLLEAVRLTAGMHLLDVATGPGAVTAAASMRGARPVGIDLSPRMVELARRLHPGIEFHEADVERLPFSNETFDAVVGCFALGHLPCPEAAVAECLRTLKPGGRIAFAWWDDPSRQRIQGLFREAVAEVGIAPPVDVPAGHSSLRFCDTGEFRRLLAGAGLADVEVVNHTAAHLVKSADALWHGGLNSMVLTGAAIRAQSEETQETVRRAFVRRALAYQGESGLKIPIAFNIGAGRKPH
jgi:SAM-dependent methyltransferase